MKYRPEIDGLRALAVVPVILFHAGFETFSGGFVGVDVFFVISGYLITTILIEDIENDRFSLLNFYERRARRILPALFFVMFVCIPFAWMWMLPSQMKGFSQSLVAVSLFASNVLFWKESGYFDAAAEEKPLLHTWSLAVEEQFYVLFPIFLFLAWRYGKNRVFWMIVAMASVSLLLSEWGWRNKASANFYLAPTRAWELFSGSIAAFVVQKRGIQRNNFLALLGLTAIVFSIFFYDESTPFPSVYALVPVLGVVLLIFYADRDTLAAKLLSTKAFVRIGLISYSAYLWHQPLFAFVQIRFLNQTSDTLMLILSVISVLLAYVTWKFIEAPFRNRQLFKPGAVYNFSLVGLSVFMCIGLLGHMGIFTVQNHSITQLTQTSESIPIYESQCGLQNLSLNTFCRKIGDVTTSPSILILGDSHAAASLASIADTLYRENKSALRIGFGGCTPIKNIAISRADIFDKCISLNNEVYDEFLASNRFENIILISRWTAHWLGSSFDNQEGGVEVLKINGNPLTALSGNTKTISKDVIAAIYKESLKKLSELSNLVIVYPIPEAGWNVPKALKVFLVDGLAVTNQTLSTSSELYDERNEAIVELFDSINFSIKRVVTKDIFCDSFVEKRCVTILDSVPLYYDDDHLSKRGADLLAKAIFDKLK